MAIDYIDAHLPEPLAKHVERIVGPKGYYETPSEYIRSLIRRDMEETDLYQTRETIREGYDDIKENRYFKSTGDFFKDREIFQQNENNDWK